ncbi:MAG TPA: restriction endonuclease subunit R [Verrucomicrobiae bacterium]|jgi:hypothetical protein
MANIPQKVADQFVAGIKKFQPILTAAQAHDANESDTVIIITDMLSEIFGYDKYKEITSEKCIRGTFCDLSIKVDDITQSYIEAKAINQELKENYVKQAVDYAVNGPIDWVVLTNGIHWRIFKVIFSKPVDHELVVDINFLELNHHNASDLETLYLFTRESWAKSALNDFYEQKQALSRFSIGAVLLTDPVLTIVKRELKRISPDVKIDTDQIRFVLEQEVLKREVVECEKADEARKRIARVANKALRNKTEKNSADENISDQKPSSEVSQPTATATLVSPPPN